MDAGDWELVGDQFTPGWDNQEAQRIMEQMLVAADDDVDAVFAANDGPANSAINALDAAGIDATGVPVSGQDATVAGIQNILLGRQTMTVYKPIEAEAKVAAAVALRALSRAPAPATSRRRRRPLRRAAAARPRDRGHEAGAGDAGPDAWELGSPGANLPHRERLPGRLVEGREREGHELADPVVADDGRAPQPLDQRARDPGLDRRDEVEPPG
ncbi:MAG TPA: substrate-binding domain-containing protein, partial [Gaiellaceae bacterium]|nr:substrate-binding domain-containing protein [Gaiellaceae bacterium]